MPTVTVRPNSTIAAGGTVTGAASRQAATSDDSDSSYVSIGPTGGGGQFTVGFPTPVLPSNGVWRSFKGRVRLRAQGAFSITGEVIVGLSGGAGTTIVAPSPGTTFADFASAPVTVSGFPTGLAAYVHFAGDVVAATDLQTAELYIDALYAAQPSVVVSAPSGAITTTTQPTVSWVHTAGTDGGAQSQAQVKVFNAAQYSAGGFTPDGSTAFWAVDITGSTASTVPTAQLVDDNYRAYVRTAQSINGVAHWADWAFSAFTIDSDPPPAPSITAAADNANAWIRLVATIDDTQASIVAIEYSTDGGSTWTPVRGAARLDVVGDTRIAYHYEAPNGIVTLYRAQAIRAGINGDIASAWSSTASATWTSSLAYLKDPNRPAATIVVDVSVLPDPVFAATRGLHKILDSAYPVARNGVRQAQVGTLELQTRTSGEYAALHALIQSPVLLLQPPASWGMEQMYMSVGDVTPKRWGNPISAAGRQWVIPYAEVLAPVDDGIEFLTGGTWQDLLDEGGDWQDVLDSGGTWGDWV